MQSSVHKGHHKDDATYFLFLFVWLEHTQNVVVAVCYQRTTSLLWVSRDLEPRNTAGGRRAWKSPAFSHCFSGDELAKAWSTPAGPRNSAHPHLLAPALLERGPPSKDRVRPMGAVIAGVRGIHGHLFSTKFPIKASSRKSPSASPILSCPFKSRNEWASQNAV